MKRRAVLEPCPCGSGRPHAACCGPYIDAGVAAADAESLMRSRYTAYVRGATDYLLATWHPSTRPETLVDDAVKPRWIGLEVRSRRVVDADRAQVEFVARYRVGGRAARLHELSRFVREDGRWYYVDGDRLA